MATRFVDQIISRENIVEAREEHKHAQEKLREARCDAEEAAHQLLLFVLQGVIDCRLPPEVLTVNHSVLRRALRTE